MAEWMLDINTVTIVAQCTSFACLAANMLEDANITHQLHYQGCYGQCRA